MVSHEQDHSNDELLSRLDRIEQSLTRISDRLASLDPKFPTGRYMTVAEACKEYKLSRATVYKMSPPTLVKIGGSTRINREILERRINKGLA